MHLLCSVELIIALFMLESQLKTTEQTQLKATEQHQLHSD